MGWFSFSPFASSLIPWKMGPKFRIVDLAPESKPNPWKPTTIWIRLGIPSGWLCFRKCVGWTWMTHPWQFCDCDPFGRVSENVTLLEVVNVTSNQRIKRWLDSPCNHWNWNWIQVPSVKTNLQPLKLNDPMDGTLLEVVNMTSNQGMSWFTWSQIFPRSRFSFLPLVPPPCNLGFLVLFQ